MNHGNNWREDKSILTVLQVQLTLKSYFHEFGKILFLWWDSFSDIGGFKWCKGESTDKSNSTSMSILKSTHPHRYSVIEVWFIVY